MLKAHELSKNTSNNFNFEFPGKELTYTSTKLVVLRDVLQHCVGVIEGYARMELDPSLTKFGESIAPKSASVLEIQTMRESHFLMLVSMWLIAPFHSPSWLI